MTHTHSRLSTIMGEKRLKISTISRDTGISRATLTSLYYDRMPDTQPDAVYVEAKYPDVVDYLCGLYGYATTQVQTGWILTRD